MKNVLKLVLLVGGAVPAWGGTLSATLFFDPANPFAYVGTTFNVNVGVTLTGDGNQPNPNGDLTAYQFDLAFPSFLTAISVTDAGYFAATGDSFVSGSIDNTNDVISGIANALNGTPPPDSGTDTLVTVQFLANAIGTGPVSTANETLLDSNFNSIALNPETPATVTTSPTPEPGTVWMVLLLLCAGAITRRLKPGPWRG
jgi:hypothetical protein